MTIICKDLRVVLLLSAALGAIAAGGPAHGQTFTFEGSRENNNPILNPPGGRCVPPYFNTVLIGPGAISSTGLSNLGPFTSTQSHCVDSAPPTALSDGIFTYTFRAGDTITGTYTGAATNSATPGVFTANENLVITGGTGRFTGANGTITSNGELRIVPGPNALFQGTLTGSIMATATVEGEFATALGQPAAALGRYSTSIGTLSIAGGERSVALGSFAEATGAGSIALGDATVSSGPASVALGQGAVASAAAAHALGHNSVASGIGSFAGGVQAQATSLGAVSIGRLSAATGDRSTAIGNAAVASSTLGTAIGTSSLASGLNATAVGVFTQATGMGATALGNAAVATQAGSVGLGVRATASGINSTAVGALSTASATGATALGRGSTAAFEGSTAVGFGAATTAANQVTLGAAGTSVRIGDVAASTAAQSGTVSVATVDANGTLGRDTGLIPAVTALQGASTAQATRLTTLELAGNALNGRVDQLFDLRDLDRRDMRQGIAASVAMGQASMPSAPGRTSFVFNGAAFRGEFAVGGSVMHRIGGSNPLAIGAGFSFAGNKNNAVRLGMAGEF